MASTTVVFQSREDARDRFPGTLTGKPQLTGLAGATGHGGVMSAKRDCELVMLLSGPTASPLGRLPEAGPVPLQVDSIFLVDLSHSELLLSNKMGIMLRNTLFGSPNQMEACEVIKLILSSGL